MNGEIVIFLLLKEGTVACLAMKGFAATRGGLKELFLVVFTK